MSANLMSLARSGGKFLKLFGDRKMMKLLPYDAEVEYLESSGTQWIDTRANANSNLSVEIKMANVGTPWNNVNPIGAILTEPLYRHHINFPTSRDVTYYFGNNTSSVHSGYSPADAEIFTFKVDAISKEFTLGTVIGTFPNDTFDTGLSYWLFGRNGTTPPYLGLLRIYSAKLWDGNILARDFIPVRFTNELGVSEGAMYDKVSGQLYRNSGTGAFIIGPDKTI